MPTTSAVGAGSARDARPTSWPPPACRRRGTRPGRLSSTTSSTFASSSRRRRARWPSSTAASLAAVHGRAAELQRARARSCRRRSATRSVSPWTTSMSSIGMPSSALAQHRPRGVVALAVRRGAGVDGRPSRRAAPRPWRTRCPPVGRGDLDVDDTPMPSWRASPASRAPGLLGPELVVAGGLEDQVEARARSRRCRRSCRWASCTGTASAAMRFMRRTSAGSMPISAAKQVHRPLDGGGGLGPAGAAVGDDAGVVLVTTDAGVALDLRDVVDARAPSSGS